MGKKRRRRKKRQGGATTQGRRYKAPERPLVWTEGHDNYNFAGEYRAREVEFGHGRAKSKEWNDEEARRLKGELRKLRRIRKRNPDLFDRDAIKP